MAATSSPQSEYQLPLSQDQKLCLTQALSKLLLLRGILECVRLCVHSLKMESVSYGPLALPRELAFRANILGGSSPQYRIHRLGSLMWGVDLFTPWGEPLQLLLSSCLWVTQLRVWVLTILHLNSPYPSHCGSYFISLVVKDLFCQFSGHSHHWRRKWQPTPVPLPGKSYGQRSVVRYSPRGCKELDTTEQLHSLTLYHQWQKIFSASFQVIFINSGSVNNCDFGVPWEETSTRSSCSTVLSYGSEFLSGVTCVCPEEYPLVYFVRQIC